MRAYLRQATGYGPLGLLLALVLILVATLLGLDALRQSVAAVAEPLRLLLAAPEMGGALAALFLSRRLQDLVPQEVRP